MNVTRTKECQRAAGPLEGVTVVELGSLIAGPFATRLLGDYGARVIKVEAPDALDPMRDWGHVTYRDRHLWWLTQARNKELITLNLRTRKGQDLFRQLVPHIDIVVENFRPGTLEKWELAWETLHALNPRLILVRVSGFGQTGPYRERTGFGSVAEAMGGLRYLNGFPDRPPTRFGISLGDSLGSLYAVIGALAAIHAREKTGEGQMVDCAITEAVFSLLESAVSEYGLTGYVRERQGNILPGIAPSNTYRTKDDQYLVIGANQDRVFQRLTEVMGAPNLASDPMYQTHQARATHQMELDRIIESWTTQHTLEELAAWLHEAGIPAGPIYSIEDIFSDPQFRAREMILQQEAPSLGSVPTPGIVPKFSGTPGQIRHLAREHPGQDNHRVYSEWLNLSDRDLRDLEEDGVI
ncbi:MAG: CoA transferase [Firmicutes bacterium]|nr:CoA transferase [Bacillota bacterium]